MLNKKIEGFIDKWSRLPERLKKELEEDIKASCSEMVLEATKQTPPKEYQIRGRNTVTGFMKQSWGSSYKFVRNGTVEITLYNSAPYSQYVNDGHRVTKHFVPWLYVDGSGYLAKHNPIPGEPLFGLVVGTKTIKVPPQNITEVAKNKFFDVFNSLSEATISEISQELNDEYHD